MQNNKKKCYCCGETLSCNDFYIDGIYIDGDILNKVYLCGFCHDVLKNNQNTSIEKLRQNALKIFIKSNFGITSLFQKNNLKNILDNLDRNNELKFTLDEIKKKQIISIIKFVIGITGILIVTNLSKYIEINIIFLICLCLIFLLVMLIGISELKFIKILKERNL